MQITFITNWDYTAPQRKNTGFTVLQGLESVAPPQTELIYAKGCGIRDMSKEGFQEAIDAAKRADIAVVVLADPVPGLFHCF